MTTGVKTKTSIKSCWVLFDFDQQSLPDPLLMIPGYYYAAMSLIILLNTVSSWISHVMCPEM